MVEDNTNQRENILPNVRAKALKMQLMLSNVSMKRPLAYITAAWRDDRNADTKQAAQYCRVVYGSGFSPVCPSGLYGSLWENACRPREDRSKRQRLRPGGAKPAPMASPQHSMENVKKKGLLQPERRPWGLLLT